MNFEISHLLLGRQSGEVIHRVFTERLTMGKANVEQKQDFKGMIEEA